ncbi:MAG: S41 family peptidase, partial [Gemmatimonadota bacterium]|nr:S41 family peptidase [Gemmatimonadota bacterium]
AKGLSSQDVQNKLIGDPGTPVSVTFLRTGVAAPIKLNFKRAIVHVPAVPYSMMLDDRVGYVTVSRFSEATAAEVDSNVRVLTKRGAKSIIIDLRGNGGGILDEAFNMANIFLPQGLELLSVRGRGEFQRYVSQQQPTAPDVPLLVMVDGGTASASEIVAGALQDYDRALILGQTSFGKGLVQSVYNLDGGYALKITTGKWFTPSGRSIQKERKFIDGQFVEVMPDSLETDSMRKARPVFKSKSGRTVYGGGAITPDVMVPFDTISTAEQKVARILYAKYTDFNALMVQFGLDQKGKVAPDFKVTQAWRDDVFSRISAAGIKIDKPTYDAGVAWVDRVIDARVGRAAFGDTTVKRHDMIDDAQLQRALAIMHNSATQKDVFAEAAAEAKKGGSVTKRGLK